ncbi:DUF2283 domain-containing protein [Dactylococcopsis salina]|uniref:DUF2283 domain-containing protein n=1 Tax=Dactylococcopsis salina (strain PCC 8305) TaxID=13035 RepID=K9YS90_DACS8|nr:DUF2283 domain-containing protein [Dactylococcopsis salina]AFZ49744.1 Protein of unknown function (DUF2283) [Dactylococcopsis salina PCC 8305]
MKINYNSIEKTAYIELFSSEIIESEEVTSGIVYDFDAQEKIVGIELYHIEKLSIEELKSLYQVLETREEKQQLSDFLTSLIAVQAA